MFNTDMTHDDHERLNQRLEALEIKANYTDDQLEQLDRVIIAQQAHIELLILEVQRLRQPARDVDGMLASTSDSDRPPHY